jgi:hypothetical protein
VRAICFLVLVALVAGPLAACESTQDKSARLAAHGKGLLAEEGVSVAKRSRDVEVLGTGVVHDENGTAAVVKLKNRSRRTLWQLPIAIDVRGAGSRSVFRNDQPGLEPSLAHVPLLRAGETFTWVNDQVAASGTARSVKAKVGGGRSIAAGRLPRVRLTRATLHADPVSGVAAEGVALNRSKTDLRKIVVFAVAWRGRRAVAAGKAQIPRLKPGRRARFQAFLIGNPRGARLELAAPPPSLG